MNFFPSLVKRGKGLSDVPASWGSLRLGPKFWGITQKGKYGKRETDDLLSVRGYNFT
jgi:hypothetical protein